MTKLQILKSDKEGKKWKAVFTKDDGKTKTVHFGASGYQDYTQHHDKTLNLNLNGVNVTSTNGDTVGAIISVIDENKYRFSFTPTTSGTTKLNINNALDVNNFYYPLFQSGLLNINAAFEFSIASGSVTYTQPTGQTFFYPLILDSSTVVTTPYFANWDGVRLLSPGLPSDGSYGFCGNSININGELVATIAANYGKQIQPKTIRVKTYLRGDTPWQYFKLFGSNTLSDLNNTGIISNTMIQVGPTFENVLTEQDIIDGKTFQLVAAEGRDMYFNLQPVLNTTYQYWTFYFIVRPGYNGALSLHTIEFME